jgi:predicted transcriptional regulator
VNAFDLSRLLIDKYSAKILTFAKDRPKSVQEMCDKLGIPMTLGYRRVNTLLSEGLLSCEGRTLSQGGKWTRLYMSQVKRAYIFFDDGRVRLKFELISGQTRWSEDWVTPAAT